MVVLKELIILQSLSWWGMCWFLKELICKFLHWEDVVVLKGLIIFTVSTLEGYVFLKKLICMFLLWEDVVVLKEHIGRVWWP